MPNEHLPRVRRVAILPWGDVIEDFLEPIGWTLDDFLQRMSGGWLFGYIDALQTVGIESTLIVFTRDRRAPRVTTHAPTGTRVRLIPSPLRYRALRIFYRSAYHWIDGDTHTGNTWPRPLRAMYDWGCDALPYLATDAGILTRSLADERCDAIICQEYEEVRFDRAIEAGVRLGIPVYASFQGARARRSTREVHERQRSMHHAAALIIGSSRERARVETAYNVEPSRIAPILNPLDARLWFPEKHPTTRPSLGIGDDEILVTWHGRVAFNQKGIDILLDAWLEARRQVPALRLLMIGTGDDAPRLRESLATMPHSGIVWIDRYISDRTEMRHYLSASDLAVLSSRYEGFAVAPLEAMACGLPLVATDVEGVADIAPAGEGNGVVVVPREEPSVLAGAIVRLANDRNLRSDLATRATHRISEAFSLDAVGRSLGALLNASR